MSDFTREDYIPGQGYPYNTVNITYNSYFRYNYEFPETSWTLET